MLSIGRLITSLFNTTIVAFSNDISPIFYKLLLVANLFIYSHLTYPMMFDNTLIKATRLPDILVSEQDLTAISLADN